MSNRAAKQTRSDSLVLLGLAWAAAAACVTLVVTELGPLALLPVGIAALPLAASRRSALAFRVLAVLLLGALAPTFGLRLWLLFAPTGLALLASCARLLTPRPASRRRR